MTTPRHYDKAIQTTSSVSCGVPVEQDLTLSFKDKIRRRCLLRSQQTLEQIIDSLTQNQSDVFDLCDQKLFMRRRRFSYDPVEHRSHDANDGVESAGDVLWKWKRKSSFFIHRCIPWRPVRWMHFGILSSSIPLVQSLVSPVFAITIPADVVLICLRHCRWREKSPST